jgi:SAM-dependent methyltransferase
MPEPWYRSAFGSHYRTLYAHRDAREAARCVALLAAAGVLADPVLDLGCGDGRHLPALAEHAGQVVGVDLSPDLLEAARERRSPASLVRADMRRLPLAAGACGAVVSLFTAFGYFADDRENERPVAEVSRVLRAGGHWCLDVPDGDRIRAELGDGRPRVREREAGPLAVRESRRWDEASRTVRKHVLIRSRAAGDPPGAGEAELEYEERVRIYDLPELADLAARHGLSRVRAWGGYGGEALTEGERWLLVFRREPGARGVAT